MKRKRDDKLGQYEFMAPINREMPFIIDDTVWLQVGARVQNAVRRPVNGAILRVLRGEALPVAVAGRKP